MPGVIIIGVGLLLGLVLGLFRKIPNQKTVRGTIVTTECKRAAADRRITYSAVVEYQVGLQAYHVRVPWNSSAFREGQTMTVAYNAANPAQAIVRPGLMERAAVFALILAGAVIAWLRFTGQI